MTLERPRLSAAELEAETASTLPDKQVISLLNLDVDLDVALDLAAPIDLAVAANAQAALPINASVSADVLTIDSASAAQATQATSIDQYLSGDAIADAPQTALIDQEGTDVPMATAEATEVPVDGTDGTDGTVGGTLDGTDTDGVTGTVGDVVDDANASVDQLVGSAGNLMEGGLLNVDVDAAVDADLAAPVAGAVAANANVAAPINASVSANIGTIGSESVAVADQTAIITQTMEDVTAQATATQDAEIIQ